jgi:hypothetical protein
MSLNAIIFVMMMVALIPMESDRTTGTEILK